LYCSDSTGSINPLFSLIDQKEEDTWVKRVSDGRLRLEQEICQVPEVGDKSREREEERE
jgi:hypothetical protein